MASSLDGSMGDRPDPFVQAVYRDCDRLPPASDTDILALGLSDAVPGFNPPPNVVEEIDRIVLTADRPPKPNYNHP